MYSRFILFKGTYKKMNEVFLIGKILSDVEFSFIINDKKKKSIVNFEMIT